MPGGRPSEYKSEYAEGAKRLARLGATDEEVADFYDVDVRTIYRWKNTHKEFCQALKVGKEEADVRVERSLYHRAIGYTHDEDKIFNNGGEALVVPTKKHYAPDTTAAIFWLKNRKPEEWRDKQEVEDVTPVENKVSTAEEMARAVAFILAKGTK